MTYSHKDIHTTKEEQRAFLPFFPDMRDISQDDEYAECVHEANVQYPATFGHQATFD